jgi:hypothetical protein
MEIFEPFVNAFSIFSRVYFFTFIKLVSNKKNPVSIYI